MRDRLIEFLKALEVAVPPQSGHHSITFARYGSDETGWQDKLALGIRVDGSNRVLFLEDGDLEKSTAYLVKECTSTLAACTPAPEESFHEIDRRIATMARAFGMELPNADLVEFGRKCYIAGRRP